MGWDLMLFVGAGVTILAGCLVPNRWLPALPNDKLLHFAAFALLSVLALRVATGETERWLWLFGLLVGGWIIECLQTWIPDREFCWRDIAANALGIACVAAGYQLSVLFA